MNRRSTESSHRHPRAKSPKEIELFYAVNVFSGPSGAVVAGSNKKASHTSAMAMRSFRGVSRLLSYHIRHAGSIATQSETSVVRRGSAKVSDRMVQMTAIDEDGQRHLIKGLSGHTLLRTLVDRGLLDPERHRLEDITACGAECEVSIANEWLDKLPPRTEDELEVLKDRTHARKADPHARLGCQIVLEPELEGMVISIAEEKPWRTL